MQLSNPAIPIANTTRERSISSLDSRNPRKLVNDLTYSLHYHHTHYNSSAAAKDTAELTAHLFSKPLQSSITANNIIVAIIITPFQSCLHMLPTTATIMQTSPLPTVRPSAFVSASNVTLTPSQTTAVLRLRKIPQVH